MIRTNGVTSEQAEAQQYPALLNMIRGYFNQDSEYISEDPEEVVRVFREESPRPNLIKVIGDIQRFLTAYSEDDPELSRVFERVFQPETCFHRWMGQNTRESLLRVVEILLRCS